jgi:hypothetical protein
VRSALDAAHLVARALAACSLCGAVSSCGDAATVRAAGTGPAAASPMGPAGGSPTRLLFACVGDTRPPSEDDTAGYPTEIITQIFAGIQAVRPRPSFVVSTGDYMFASSRPDTQAAPQLDLYMQARARFAGTLFPAMGNHECTGATSSNCGPGAENGVTTNYAAFVRTLLSPIRENEPYYVVPIAAADGTWTAKLVFVAANAWSPAQETWLESALSQPTTYTFVVRHEPAAASTAPGVSPSEAIMGRHPYTLAIVGHSHTYRHPASNWREVLIGNGGAPLTGKDYGFGLFSQRSDGAIVVDMMNWRTRQADPAFHFVVQADGTPGI